MRLDFSYRSGHTTSDLTLSARAGATVADLIAALNPDSTVSATLTLSVQTPQGQVQLRRSQVLTSDCLPRGAVVQVCPALAPAPGLVLPTLLVTAGPSRGQRFTMMAGSNTIGRNAAADVTLNDPAISGQHARIIVDNGVEIVDNNSANGLRIDGVESPRARLTDREHIWLGDTELRLEPAATSAAGVVASAQNRIIRSPRLAPTFPARELPGPDLPKRPVRPHFPLTMLVAPLFMGAALYAITGRVASLLFVVLMPMMMIGMWFENRRSMRRQVREGWARFRADLNHIESVISSEQERERLVRLAQHPSAGETITSARERTSLLWSRRPDLPGFGACRLAVGTTQSIVTIARASSSGTEPAAWNEVEARCGQWGALTSSPISTTLAESGGIAVVGNSAQNAAVAAGLLLQLAGLHSPSELNILGLIHETDAARWDWLKWLPHAASGATTSTSTGAQTPRVAVGEPATGRLVTELRSVIAERFTPNEPVCLPLVVVVVADDDLDVAALAAIGEVGPAVGVHLLWVCEDLQQVPAALRAFIVMEPDGSARIGQVGAPESIQPVRVEQVSPASALAAARVLAPYVDATAGPQESSQSLPSTINYLRLVGTAMAQEATAIVGRWLETGSIAAEARPTQRPTSLRALLGVTEVDPLVVDLIGQGPHALVGGTTGSGKSELLQTWVMALANDYAPDRLTFLFVDYKGGAAFSDCVLLPHCVGLVTDLTPALVSRSLSSLNAELKYREAVLSAAGCKDLEAMEQRALPDTPPRLVVLVDEFAALVSDVPEFVDGMVDIAQRGRSLGIHLILATQRPAGVIKDNLRANTNIRIALRMADTADSVDVIKGPEAATFDPTQPGRAALKCGSGPAIGFQTAWLGGRQLDEPLPPAVVLADFTISAPASPPPAKPGNGDVRKDSDLRCLVNTIAHAARRQRISKARRPWLPPLPTLIELSELRTERTPSFLPLGYSDNPAQQSQPVVGFAPDRSGNLAIYGTSGAGKTTTLIGMAALAGHTAERDLSHVYAVDCASGALQGLQKFPHVGAVIGVSETERISRLFSHLTEILADRAAAFSALGATSLPEYRQATGQGDIPRVFVLLDGLAAFRQATENAPDPNPLQALLNIATLGRGLGVHVIWTCERAGAVPAGLAAVTSDRIVLRLASADEATLLRVPQALADELAPGAGRYQGHQVQVGRWSQCADEPVPWSSAVPRPIRTLPRTVRVSDLPVRAAGRAAIGLRGDSLQPFGLETGGIQLLAGGSQADRGRIVRGILQSVARNPGQMRTCLLGPAASLLSGIGGWDYQMVGPEAVAARLPEFAAELESSDPGSWLVLLEDAPGFVNGPADLALQQHVTAGHWRSQTMLAEGDISGLQMSWPLLSQLRAARRGFLLQPDQVDGDLLFRTPLPRLARRDACPGRGFRVQAGAAELVQLVQADATGG